MQKTIARLSHDSQTSVKKGHSFPFQTFSFY